MNSKDSARVHKTHNSNAYQVRSDQLSQFFITASHHSLETFGTRGNRMAEERVRICILTLQLNMVGILAEPFVKTALTVVVT